MSKPLLAILALALIFGAGVFAWLQMQPKADPIVSPAPVVSEPVVAEPEPIDTSDWKTYRNEEYGFEFKYPKGHQVSERESGYSSQKTYQVTVTDGNNPLISISLTGKERSIPEEGGCWTYVGTPLDLSGSNKDIEDRIEQEIPNVELVSKLLNVQGVEFYCIGSYAAVLSYHMAIIPLQKGLYANATVYGPLVAMNGPGDIDHATKEEWNVITRQLRESVLNKEFLTDSNIAHKEALFSSIVSSFRVNSN